MVFLSNTVKFTPKQFWLLLQLYEKGALDFFGLIKIKGDNSKQFSQSQQIAFLIRNGLAEHDGPKYNGEITHYPYSNAYKKPEIKHIKCWLTKKGKLFAKDYLESKADNTPRPFRAGDYVAFGSNHLWAGRVLSVDTNGMLFVATPERINGKNFFATMPDACLLLKIAGGQANG